MLLDAAGDRSLWLLQQANAGCSTVNSLMYLAGHVPQLSSQTAFKLGAACGLVFGPGANALHYLLAAATDPGHDQEAAAADLMITCGVQLSAVLSAITRVISRSRYPQAAAAFANSTAKPLAILPWVQTLSCALLVAAARAEPGEELASAMRMSCLPTGMSPSVAHLLPCCKLSAVTLPKASSCTAGVCQLVLHNYLSLINILLSNSTWAVHAAKAAADSQLLSAVARVLMECCLPATRAAVVEGEAASGAEQGGHAMRMLYLSAVLTRQPAVAPELRRWAQAGDVAAACGHAAAILAAIPVDPPSSMCAGTWSSNLVSAAALTARMCMLMTRQHSTADLQAAAIPSQPGVAAPAASPAQAVAAGWSVVAQLPQLTSAIATLVASAQVQAAFPHGTDSWLSWLRTTCSDMSQPLHTLLTLQLQHASPCQLASWLTAAAASLRLLSSMSLLDDQFKQHDMQFRGAEMLRSQLEDWLAARLPQQLAQLGGRQQAINECAAALSAEEAVAWDGLSAQLWMLHTGLCRLVAALTAPSAAHSVSGLHLKADGWRLLQRDLNTLLLLAAAQGAQPPTPTWAEDCAAAAPRQVEWARN